MPPRRFARTRLCAALSLACLSVPALAQTNVGSPVGSWNSVQLQTGNQIQATTIAFGGQQWVVLPDRTGYAGTQPGGTAMLFLKNTSSGWSSTEGVTYTPYSFWDSRINNFYKDSRLQQHIEDLANALPGKEQGMMKARNLAPIDNGGVPTWDHPGTYTFPPEPDTTNLYTGDGIRGDGVDNQKLWALSLAEYKNLYGDFTDTDPPPPTRDLLAYDQATVPPSADFSDKHFWWLRSHDPDPSLQSGALIGNLDRRLDVLPVDYSFCVRPGFDLLLTDVLFTSAASGNSQVFSAAAPNQEGIRLVFADVSIATPALTLKSGNAFDFSGGTVSSDMKLSGFLQDSANTHHFYAQLADASTGSGSFDLSGIGAVSDGSYVLHLFGEETAGDLHSGFAGDSVDFQATFRNGALVDKLFLLRSPVNFSVDGGVIGFREGANIDGDFSASNDAHLDFRLASATGPILSVSGTADIGDDTNVQIGVEGNVSLRIGEPVVLIQITGPTGKFSGTPKNDTYHYTKGILRYDFKFLTNARQLLAIVFLPDTEDFKAIPEGDLAGMAFANQGADMAAGLALALRESRCLAATQTQDKRTRCDEGHAAFALSSAGWSRYDTGSHADVESLRIMAGIAGDLKLASGDLTLSTFIEYGDGNYDTRNALARSAGRIRGSGDAEYAGAGLLARLDWADTEQGHSYAEGSIRAGRIKSDFNAVLTLSSNELVPARYDSSSQYRGLHLGTGYVWTLTEQSTLDTHVKYFHARRGRHRARLDTTPDRGGNDLRFEAIESRRVRIGARYAWRRDAIEPYLGLAYEHEFDGKARASIDDVPIVESPKLKGGTGIAEIGLTVKPSPGQPVSVDLGIRAYAGQRQGVSGNLKLEYRF